MRNRQITSIEGRVLAALALASCVPLDDLSHYSQGGEPGPDAGHQSTNATLDPQPVAVPGSLLRPPPRPDPPPKRGDAPSESPEVNSPEPGEAAAVPEPIVDAGSPPRLPEGCVTRLDADAGVGSCYAISLRPLSWSAALAACADWGGSLVSINSAEESDWLAATVGATIWIGANDRQREGTFGWANGDAFQFERFAVGEPDNTLGVQDCVERRADSSWNDRACNAENPFVCERPL